MIAMVAQKDPVPTGTVTGDFDARPAHVRLSNRESGQGRLHDRLGGDRVSRIEERPVDSPKACARWKRERPQYLAIWSSARSLCRFRSMTNNGLFVTNIVFPGTNRTNVTDQGECVLDRNYCPGHFSWTGCADRLARDFHTRHTSARTGQVSKDLKPNRTSLFRVLVVCPAGPLERFC